jgi:hypothetical protein
MKLEIDLYELIVDCNNPDGESPNAQGIVHQVSDATVSSQVSSGDWYFVKGGKVYVDGDIITDPEILSASNISPGEVCPNDNWQLDLISVTDFDARIIFLIGDSGTCNPDNTDGCTNAEITYYVGCTFGPNPQPGDEPICDEIYTEEFDYKAAL